MSGSALRDLVGDVQLLVLEHRDDVLHHLPGLRVALLDLRRELAEVGDQRVRPAEPEVLSYASDSMGPRQGAVV